MAEATASRSSAPRATTAPIRVYWEPDEAARRYHGDELTLWEPHRPCAAGTTHRNDFRGLGQRNAWPYRGNRAPKPPTKFDGESTYHHDYPAWPLPPAAPRRPAEQPPRSFPGQWDTTHAASYTFPRQKAAAPSRRERPAAAPRPFEGISTHLADYQPWPLRYVKAERPSTPANDPIPFRGQTIAQEAFQWPQKDRTRAAPARPPRPPPQRFDGQSEYTAKYVKLKLPPGLPCALGMQIASKPYAQGGVGGQFLGMIPAGTAAPMVATQMLTTTRDMQDTGCIVVVAKREGDVDGMELGHFNMEQIKPAKYGTQTVTVTFKLVAENQLHCSAFYKQGNRKCHLTFKDRAPLRSVAQLGM
ncbi:hypothetical protein AB1Y20_020663 [Prymnesium parvum]|uniref:Uncharacterized protein n=1 Tax=Prymnesium parvum TaxID=97485 RepID=A0AB34JYP3_PRYPA